jgi:hypothetical protein
MGWRVQVLQPAPIKSTPSPSPAKLGFFVSGDLPACGMAPRGHADIAAAVGYMPAAVGVNFSQFQPP